MKKLDSSQLTALIERAEYQRFGETTTVCALILRGGFTVIGHSGCLNPDDFDEQIGRDIAYQNAFEQLWEMQGYHLKMQDVESEQKNDTN